MTSRIGLFRNRRSILGHYFGVGANNSILEESCVPSYLHKNLPAAAVSWNRLFVAAAYYKRFAKPGPILDFGAGTGELWHILQPRDAYSFCEANDILADALK